MDPTYSTFLTSAYTTGTTLAVTSTTSFAASDFLVVGQPNEEEAELKQLSSVTDVTNLAIASALNFPHPVSTPVYRTLWDQVEIEVDTGSGFSTLTQSSIQWDNPQGITVYIHTGGSNSTQYRFRFRNSSSNTYSDYSHTITGAAVARNSVQYMVDNVRRIIDDPNGRIVSTDEIIRDLNEAQDIIGGRPVGWWFLRFSDSSIPTVAGTTRYNLDLLGGGVAGTPVINLNYIDKVRFNFNDGTENTIYPLDFNSYTEFDDIVRDNDRDADNNAVDYTLDPPDDTSDNGYLNLAQIPESAVGTLYIRGFKLMPLLEDVSDTTVVPIPSLLENFAIAKAFRTLGNEQKAGIYEELFFGPPSSLEKVRKLIGIPLLESQNQARKRPQGQARSLFRFRGNRRYFGDRSISRDEIHERYW